LAAIWLPPAESGIRFGVDRICSQLIDLTHILVGKAASALPEHAVAPKHGGKSAGLQPGGHQFLGRKEEIAFR
jgi:hypothetical protein